MIRSKTDHGTVTILDNRVINKRYGKYFMESIPTRNIRIVGKSAVLKDIEADIKGGYNEEI